MKINITTINGKRIEEKNAKIKTNNDYIKVITEEYIIKIHILDIQKIIIFEENK